MLRLAPFLFVTLAAGPALAGATPWQIIAPGVKARLISADVVTGGTAMAGLELDLPRGTNIYWRIPGETGIPTEIDFAGSSGVGTPAVSWPYPEINREGGYLDYIYRGSIVLPITLRPSGDSATLVVKATMGVCSDMCVPVTASFSLPISFGKADPGQSIRLDQAQANVPIAWDQPGEPVRTVTATARGIELDGLDHSIDPSSLIVDVGDPAILFETPQKSPDGTVWTAKLLGGAAATGLEGRGIRLTFMTRSGPYFVARQIAAPAN